MPKGNYRTKIIGLGKYIPEKTVSSEELEKRLKLAEGWIKRHTGVEKRHFATTEQTVSDLAAKAAQIAINNAGIDKREIDLIISSCSVGDMPLPSTASIIQNKLKAYGTTTFDVNCTCLGFLMGMDIARHFISAGKYKVVLITGADISSRVINWQDKESATLLGDGAAAFILKAEEAEKESGGSDIIHSFFKTDGRECDAITIKAGGMKYHPSVAKASPKMFLFDMDGLRAFKSAMVVANDLVKNLCQGSGWVLTDVDLVIPHQANLRAIEKFMKKAGVPMEKCFININKYGNTAAASIPLAFKEAVEEGRLKRGNKVFLIGTSAGFSWGGLSLIY